MSTLTQEVLVQVITRSAETASNLLVVVVDEHVQVPALSDPTIAVIFCAFFRGIEDFFFLLILGIFFLIWSNCFVNPSAISSLGLAKVLIYPLVLFHDVSV